MRIMHPTGLRDWVGCGRQTDRTAGVVSAPIAGSYRANLLTCRCISGIMGGGIAIALPLNGFPIALVPVLIRRNFGTSVGARDRQLDDLSYPSKSQQFQLLARSRSG